MANRTKTYKTSDWKIWTFQPTPGDFIIGESLLGGSDVLGASAGAMAILDAEITSLTIQDGGQPSDGIFVRPTPSTLDASILVKDFQMKDAFKFQYGSPIWVTLENAETYDAQTYGKNTPFFFGKIRSFDVSVVAGADFSSLSITGTSTSADDLNSQLTIVKNTSTDKSTLVENAATGQKSITSIIPDSGYNFADTSTETKTYAEWLDDLITCNQFIAGDQNQNFGYSGTSTAPVYNYSQYIAVQSSTVNPSSGYIFYDTDVTDLQINWSGYGSPTSVALDNYFDPDIEYTLAGTNPLDPNVYNYAATVDVKDVTQMESIAKKMLSMTQRFTTTQVTVLMATNNQDLEFTGLIGAWTYYLYPVKHLNIGYPVRVYLPDLGMNTGSFNVDNIASAIIGRTIEVTPDQWTTTYELWKGFTN